MDNMAQELQAIIKPDLYMATDLKKGAQLAVMAMPHAFDGTTMSNDPHVNFLDEIRKREVPTYCLLNQEVATLKPPEVMERNPWLILVIVALALYCLYYYNKNS